MKPASLKDKVSFLKNPSAYGTDDGVVSVLETHTSWVFLVGDSVYKMKKPMRLPALDFTRLESRERNCREELRLNRRLAPDVYRDVIPLVRRAEGSLHLGGEGAVIDWLVWMRRLPQERMLDVLLSEHRLSLEQLNALGDVLARFYSRAERPAIRPWQVMDSFRAQQDLNRQVLLTARFEVDHALINSLVAKVDGLLGSMRESIEARVAGGHYVEGHGDLRPEHICFTEPLVIFDCLEFSRMLRTIDPFDEIAFLDMECAYLGADWVGPALRGRMEERLHEIVPNELYRFYAAFRALMRARMALGHLYFGSSTDIAKWQAKTDRYARLADRYLNSL